jgi:hypothetical protein
MLTFFIFQWGGHLVRAENAKLENCGWGGGRGCRCNYLLVGFQGRNIGSAKNSLTNSERSI